MKTIQLLFEEALNKNDIKTLDFINQQVGIIRAILGKHNLDFNIRTAIGRVLKINYRALTPETTVRLIKWLYVKNEDRSFLCFNAILAEKLDVVETFIMHGTTWSEDDRKTVEYQKLKKTRTAHLKVAEARLSLELMKQAILFPKWRPLTDPVKDAMYNCIVQDSDVLAAFINEIIENKIPNPFDEKQWQKFTNTLTALDAHTSDVTKRLQTNKFLRYVHPSSEKYTDPTLTADQKNKITDKSVAIMQALLKPEVGLNDDELKTLREYLQLNGNSTSIKENKIIVSAKAILDKHASLYEFTFNSPAKFAPDLKPEQFAEAQAYFQQQCFAQIAQEAQKNPRFLEHKCPPAQFCLTPGGHPSLCYSLDQAAKEESSEKLKALIEVMKEVCSDVRLSADIKAQFCIFNLFTDENLTLEKIFELMNESTILEILAFPGVIQKMQDYNNPDFLQSLIKTINASVLQKLLLDNPGFSFERSHIIQAVRLKKSLLITSLDIQTLKNETGFDTMLVAVEADDKEVFNLLLDISDAFSETYSYSFSAVACMTIALGRLDWFFQIAGNSRFDISQSDVFECAAQHGRLSIMKYIVATLLKDNKTPGLIKPLEMAARYGHLACVEYLLFLNKDEKIHASVLEGAVECKTNNVETIQCLLASKKIDINDKKVIKTAVENSQIDNRLELLLADDQISKKTIQLGLRHAASLGSMNAIGILMKSKLADMNDCQDGSILGDAIIAKQFDCANRLLAEYQIDFSKHLSSFVLARHSCTNEKIDVLNIVVSIFCDDYDNQEAYKLAFTILKSDVNYALPNLAIVFTKMLRFCNEFRELYASSKRWMQLYYQSIALTDAIGTHYLKQILKTDKSAISILSSDENNIKKYLRSVIETQESLLHNIIDRAKALKPLLLCIDAIKQNQLFITEKTLLGYLQESIGHRSSLLAEFVNSIIVPNAQNPFTLKQWDLFSYLIDKVMNNHTAFALQCETTILDNYKHPSKTSAMISKHAVQTLSKELAVLRESAACSSSSSSSSSQVASTVPDLLPTTYAAISAIVAGEIENLIENKLSTENLMKLYVLLEDTMQNENEFLEQQRLRNVARAILKDAHSDRLLNFLVTPTLLDGEITPKQSDLALSVYKSKLKAALDKVIAERSSVAQVSSSHAQLIGQFSAIVVPANAPRSADAPAEPDKAERIAEFS